MFSVFEELTGLQKCPPRLDPIISIMDEPLDPIMLLFGETPDITPVPWLSIFHIFSAIAEVTKKRNFLQFCWRDSVKYVYLRYLEFVVEAETPTHEDTLVLPQGNEFIEGPGKDAAAEEIREIEELRCSAIQREGWDWLGFVGSTTEAKYSPQSFVILCTHGCCT